jgi:8-oxo-dGTP diphosphatase
MAQTLQPLNSEILFLKDHLVDQTAYTFSIIIARFGDSWIWVRHRDRLTWELPAGHLEPGESADEAAKRELYEETGALDYKLTPIVSYQGTLKGSTVYGKIYFAMVTELGPLPGYEIAEISLFKSIPDNLTYPNLQPYFFNTVLEMINEQDFISLTKLPNIGITLAEHLLSAGIHSPADLTSLGTEEVFKRIQSIMPDACISQLYAIEGAIQGVRWHSIDSARKEELRLFYNQLSPSNL